MFGGLAFLASGNMCRGVVGSELMVRVGPDAYEKAVARPHAREMDFTGRALKGLVYVSEKGTRSEEALRRRVEQGLEFGRSLPAK